MNRQHFLLVFVLITLITSSLSAQEQTDFPAIQRSTDWVLYQEQNGVQQYYKFEECNIPAEGFYREYILVKLVNTTSQPKIVEWDVVKWYASTCNNCDLSNPEQHRNVELGANEALEGNCSLETDKTLKMFSKFLNYNMKEWELTHFELRNYTVRNK